MDTILYLWIQVGEWKTQRERQAEWERVCTDLFLLNSSRFNQQIIDLIKWHPLLGQEPARSMRISQAKIKICLHAYWKKQTKKTNNFLTLSITSPNKPNTPLSASRLWGLASPLGWTTLKQMQSHTHSPATRSKYRQRRKDKTKELSYSAKYTVERERTREGKSSRSRISPASTP